MSTDPVYLDCNATTPLLPEVVEAMLPYLKQHFGNPSSAHAFGHRARVVIDGARSQVAALLGCEADEIVFTSGGTESNNLAVHGVEWTAARRPHPERRLNRCDGDFFGGKSRPILPKGLTWGS